MTALPSTRQVRADAGATLVCPDSPAGIRYSAESSGAAPRTDTSRRNQTLGDSLREARLRHRRDRLQRAIFALDERLSNLGASHRTRHLVAAIDGFQQELASVRAELRTLHPSTNPVPRATRVEPDHARALLLASCCPRCDGLLVPQDRRATTRAGAAHTTT